MSAIIVIVIILCVLIILFLAYLYCIAPNTKRRSEMRPYEQVYIAHRGLFDNTAPWPENSLPAFRRAVEAGYGIELDVQLSKDHQMVVFHDGDLKRMCGADLELCRLTYEELCQYTLASSPEHIPLFRDVLDVIAGRVPLIVEVKKEGDWLATTVALNEMMEGYEGLYCVESFHPGAVAWYRKNRPDIIRGQLSDNFIQENDNLTWPQRILQTNLVLNFKTRPDFIAYDHLNVNHISYWLCRHIFHVENVAWTIQSEEQLKKGKKVFQILIFDSFLPGPVSGADKQG